MSSALLDLAITTLASSKNIAVVGLSKKDGRPAHDIPLMLPQWGYHLVGVNPSAVPNVGPISVVASIDDVEMDIDILNVFRPSSDTDAIIDQALDRRARSGDVRCIWLQLGITSMKGAEKCAAAGITYIEDTCIYVVQQYVK
ncbi:MAG: CoA-binding protein [Candidatus Kapabacteria bacterium]|nr:CoA-binding protein [Candidatus Kapabacteria bacterium]